MLDTGPLSALLRARPRAARWVIAFSGGMDSHVLLDLCSRLRDALPAVPPMVALHVDHGVHPASGAWQGHCERVCGELGIPFAALRLPVGTSASEDALRDARYGAFEAFCQPGDLLLLAHHQDDQAETVLLRLLRGAGPQGLGGMPSQRPCGAAELCRPLLDVPRSSLREYAAHRGLVWIEDPANAFEHYARNLLRHRVMPLLEQRWPGAAGRIARAARHSAEAARICAERATEDLGACRVVDRFGQSALALTQWRLLGDDRRRGVLREWLRSSVGEAPEASLIDTLLHEVIGARPDASPRLQMGASVVSRFRDALFLLPVREPPVPQAFDIEPGQAREVPGLGRVSLLCAEDDSGVRRGQRYRIGFREPGLQCRLAGRSLKPLKQIFQEAGVPPWWRDRVPLLFVDGELAAVAGIGICAGFNCAPGEDSLCLSWAPPEASGV